MFQDLGVVIVAGGCSSRFSGKNKLLEKINGIPLFLYSINNFIDVCNSENIILVCSKDYFESYKKYFKKYHSDKSISFTLGGATRSESVFNGLKYLNNKVKYTAVHDAARPLVSNELIQKCYESCKKSGSGVAAKRVTDTVKLIDNSNRVLNTVDRTNLWTIETPQVFILSELVSAYKEIISNNIMVTDDAGAMEIYGKDVYIVENAKPNTKITYTSDLTYLKYLLNNSFN
ncbi:MAG TPA: 2-C-methyl-D-erythritol 4-phosphate cytidylyltransferase [Victivallales bacterium]|nr:2-C-methyl-D-erythritol 4-phosphate cytidylyltransferase [Victivallales bacterium]